MEDPEDLLKRGQAKGLAGTRELARARGRDGAERLQVFTLSNLPIPVATVQPV
jgi:hypothetical protein